jgi:hypothetical protein
LLLEIGKRRNKTEKKNKQQEKEEKRNKQRKNLFRKAMMMR